MIARIRAAIIAWWRTDTGPVIGGNRWPSTPSDDDWWRAIR